ncbi:hypothetical protein GCM10009557_10490 [Virgisporangium ochraceum]|uniref:Uncharacterized protein n=1 Tax=Virgisporangium ochraceum TaxID=65505 RepID=A0A8J3ZSH0_9ACTN|nr:hypothetical protein [Virgisporangium ochraceum]GIJ67223.1 hypothetical protein Voc01_021400 [Virgisporangium ochraceum]
MSTALEERYRSLLRILPADYRAEWEEEMVATFLVSSAPDDPEDAEYHAEFGRPPLSEVASVVGLAIRLRLPGSSTDARRPRFLGDAVRLVALIGLLVSASAGVVGTAAHLWVIGKLPGFSAPNLPGDPVTGVLPMTQALLVATALPAYLALVLGYRSAARLLASISVGAVLLTATVDLVAGHPPLAGRWMSLLLDLLVFAALWAHHDDAPPVPRKPWLLALPAVTAVTTAVFVATASFRMAGWLVDWPAIACALITVALAVHLVVGGRPEWSLAMAMLGGIVLVQRLVTLPEIVAGATADHRGAAVAAGLIEISALVLVGLPVALRARRAWRELPAEPAPTI